MTETVWSKAAGLIREGDWTTGEPHYIDPTTRKDCYCAGGAIAKAVTGDAWEMHHAKGELLLHLDTFATHVNAPDMEDPINRVWMWNDRRGTKESVLAALQELHDSEVAA